MNISRETGYAYNWTEAAGRSKSLNRGNGGNTTRG
jgi:hypothetical protein